MRARELIVFDDPDNNCFGCSPHNDRGLRLQFRHDGHEVVCNYTAPRHLEGAPEIVHGGLQATLLDEVMGVAVRVALGRELGDEAAPSAQIVTAELKVRYRRPVPVREPLVVRAEHVRADGHDHFISGRIEDRNGEALTIAEARWRHVGSREADSRSRHDLRSSD